MQQRWDRFAQERTVTIWGIGYLGYTEALRMQNLGFTPVLWDYIPGRLSAVQEKTYLDSSITAAWSLAQNIPVIAPDRAVFTSDVDRATEPAVHLICIPGEDDKLYRNIRDILSQKLFQREDALLLFLSATSPGFMDSIVSGQARCGIATAFRQDWYFEEMLTDAKPRVVGANDVRSLHMARTFFDMLQQPCTCLSSIKAAEVMAHAEQLLQNMSSTFVNQLALAFPDTDIRQIAPDLFQRLTPRLQAPTLGQMDVRQFTALRHLTSGQGDTEKLTLPKDTQRASFSLLLSYADILLSHKVSHVAILGLSPLLAAQRDPRMSPALILADYLHQHEVEITVHDPSYDAESLKKLLPYATVWHLDSPTTAEAVLIMRDIPSCRALTQQQLETLGITHARIVFDNMGMFRFNPFPDTCVYHVPGDGKLHTLRNE